MGNSEDRPQPSRRELIACALCAATLPAAAAVAGATPPVQPGKKKKLPPGKPGSLAGLHPDNVVDGYRARALDRLSDRELIQTAGEVIARPGEGMTSFTLHAPLELLARSGLLPLVAPEDRELARIQIVASAAAYGAGVEPLPEPATIGDFPSFADATRELAGVFQAGDEAGLEATVLQTASQYGVASLVHALTPALLPTLTSASHAHIGLWLLLRHGAGDPRDASLLRAAARRLATDPKARLQSFSGLDVSGTEPLAKSPAQIEREILDKLADPPKGEQPPRASIRPLMEAAEKTGNVDRYFGDLIRHALSEDQIDAAFRAVMRVSAHAMLQDDPGQAKFGWSHCFTLPQAACGLSSLGIDRKLGLATTMVWIMAYRTILSRRPLDFAYRPEPVKAASLREALHTDPATAAGRFWHADASEMDQIFRLLASEAAVRNDQHLAKYTRACFDMCGFDPGSWRLYLSSAAKLCALWIAETPREKIPDRFRDGRSTPTQVA